MAQAIALVRDRVPSGIFIPRVLNEWREDRVRSLTWRFAPPSPDGEKEHLLSPFCRFMFVSFQLAECDVRHSDNSSSALAANARMFATRSGLPVRIISARSIGPATAIQLVPGGSP